MNPNADQLWRAPRWALALLLAMLGMLAPFTIDTYIPAFAGMAQTLGATPAAMQQTLSAYFFGFAFMNLFHGALADSFGRKPVVLWGLAVFTLASAGCALSQGISALVFFRALQGLSAGAGIVVSRAVIRDMFDPAQAQKMMSQVTIYFGVAPAIAPIVGGYLYVHAGWHSIFWFLTLLGACLCLAIWRLLPETLHEEYRQPFNARHLMRGYAQLGLSPRFLLLALASGVPFNGMFLYLLSSPEFLGTHLGLAPTQFFWFFALTVAGVMSGAWVSGRLAGRIEPLKQVRIGFIVMGAVSVVNVAANLLFVPHVSWAIVPIAIYSLGWSLMTPVVTLLVLDLHPERRGMASSLQAFISSAVNGIVAGVIAPLVMHSTVALAWTSLGLLLAGLAAWAGLRYGWPDVGRLPALRAKEL
ncbi:MAG: multidrug effflux MFS transporter [Bdellovibrionales bacterium]|nr:multidrug effflux MFS transporter [Ramlibacter sp.]